MQSTSISSYAQSRMVELDIGAIKALSEWKICFFKYVVVILTFEHLKEWLLACWTQTQSRCLCCFDDNKKIFSSTTPCECITHTIYYVLFFNKMASIKGYGYIVALWQRNYFLFLSDKKRWKCNINQIFLFVNPWIRAQCAWLRVNLICEITEQW